VTSWTKGGKYREVPILTADQQDVLDAAKRLAAGGSLIPAHMSYRDQLQCFRAQCAKAGIHHVHGLRHQYAQRRYEELTGWQSPAAGGQSSRQLAVNRVGAGQSGALAAVAIRQAASDLDEP
jgi:hypothetical protein